VNPDRPALSSLRCLRPRRGQRMERVVLCHFYAASPMTTSNRAAPQLLAKPVTSACKHSGKGRDSTPQVLRFRTAWSGKRARLSLFSTSGSWNLIYRRCWITTQGYLRVFCFRNILVAKASKTFFLSLVQPIQPKIPAMLERDQAESGPSPIIRLRSEGLLKLGSPFYTGRFLAAPESSRVTSSIG